VVDRSYDCRSTVDGSVNIDIFIAVDAMFGISVMSVHFVI
jgi:hypothetical protein